MKQRENNAMRIRGFFASLSLWWFTGQVEITLGAWGIVSGIVLLCCADGWALSMLGAVLLFVVFALALMLAMFLSSSIIIPGGFAIRAACGEGREHGDKLLSFIATLALFGLFSWALLIQHANALAAAAIIGNFFVFLYNRTGRARLFLLALWFVLVVAYLPHEASFFQTEGLRTAGVVLMLCSAGLIVSGVPVLFRMLMDLAHRNMEEGNPAGDDIAYSAVTESVSGTVLRWYDPADIERALVTGTPKTRFLVASFLIDYIEPEVLPTLVKATRDRDPMVSYAACRALGQIWGPDPQEIVEWELKHGKTGTRTRRGESAFDPNDLHAMQKHYAAVEKSLIEHERLVESVLRNGVAPDEEALTSLLSLASNPLPAFVAGRVSPESATAARWEKTPFTMETRCVAAQMLGATRDHRAYALLTSLLVQDNHELVCSAAEGFKGASAEAVAHLEPLFGDERTRVRSAAIDAALWVITSLSETDAAEANVARTMVHDRAIALATHPDPETRASVMELVSQYGTESMPMLARACDDKDERVRGEALRALVTVDPDKARNYVLVALGDSSPMVQGIALNAVSVLRITEALPMVATLENDSDARVAALAKQVMLASSLW